MVISHVTCIPPGESLSTFLNFSPHKRAHIACIHCDNFIELRWRLTLGVFTLETQCYRRNRPKISSKVAKFCQKLPNFDILGAEIRWYKSLDLYCKKHLLAWAILRQNRLRGVTFRSVGGKVRKSQCSTFLHTERRSPLIRGLNYMYRSACDKLVWDFCDDWNWIMQKWYWCGQSGTVGNVDQVVNYGSAAAFIEPASSNRNVGIKIRNLTKVFACDYSPNLT